MKRRSFFNTIAAALGVGATGIGATASEIVFVTSRQWVNAAGFECVESCKWSIEEIVQVYCVDPSLIGEISRVEFSWNRY